MQPPNKNNSKTTTINNLSQQQQQQYYPRQTQQNQQQQQYYPQQQPRQQQQQQQQNQTQQNQQQYYPQQRQQQNQNQQNPTTTTVTRKPPRPPPLSVSQQQDATTPRSHSLSSESPHSPLRTSTDDPQTQTRQIPTKPISTSPPESPLPSPGPLVPTTEKYYSPLTSPLPPTPPNNPTNTTTNALSHHIISFSRREERERSLPSVGVGALPSNERKGKRVGFLGAPGEVEERERSRDANVRRGSVVGNVIRKEEEGIVNGSVGYVGGSGGKVSKVGLGVRVLEIVFCLVSFSVMATDKTQGWSGDSFDRYKEYRFCLTVNIFGFVYAGFQAFDLGYHLATGKHVISHHLRCHFDFIMDQIIAYLLISASSASASRVADWEANWGKDEFTEKASASISMAFLAFIAFAMSSLISGYNLFHRDL